MARADDVAPEPRRRSPKGGTGVGWCRAIPPTGTLARISVPSRPPATVMVLRGRSRHDCSVVRAGCPLGTSSAVPLRDATTRTVRWDAGSETLTHGVRSRPTRRRTPARLAVRARILDRRIDAGASEAATIATTPARCLGTSHRPGPPHSARYAPTPATSSSEECERLSPTKSAGLTVSARASVRCRRRPRGARR